MPNKPTYSGASGTLRYWAMTLSTLFVAFGGILLALMCIYSLPDGSTRPSVGSLFYLFSALTIIFYLILQWKKEKRIELKLSNEVRTIGRESLSDIILKWIAAIFAFMFTFLSIGIALICIYALPDQSVQPRVGVLYLISGLAVIGTFVFVVWKNWSATG
jgi:hypothetical protein